MRSPIIMFGALRSGTTLFRLMLDAHEDIANPGESDFIFDYLIRGASSNHCVYDLDGLRQDRIFQSQNLKILKSEDGREIAQDLVEQLEARAPDTYLCLAIHGNVDKALAIFSGCRIIHIVRDPRDVANSCIGMGWAGNTYFGVDQWLETERNWEVSSSLLDKHQAIELHFEDLILQPRAQLERVCKFVGVPFSPAMLSYSTKTTYAPPDPSAVEQWRTKLTPRDVALVEMKVGSLLSQRNYKMSGYPIDPIGSIEKMSLLWTNKIYKWRFACRRYGLANFALEKVTRLSKPLHAIMVRRISEIDKLYLK